MDKTENPPLVLTVAVLFSTAIPLAIVLFFSTRGVIPDVWATSRETRWLPFTGAAASYLFGSAVLFALRAPAIVVSLMLCYLGNTLVMMIITFRWKISIHASGIGGPTTVLAYASGFWGLLLSLLLIPVGWARIKLNAHTLNQFFAGALVTIVITWMQLVVYLAVL